MSRYAARGKHNMWKADQKRQKKLLWLRAILMGFCVGILTYILIIQ